MDHIERDTHTGRHTRLNNEARTRFFPAGKLAELSAGKVIVLWEFSGHVNGVRLFTRSRYIGQPDGSLAGFDSDGVCKIIHPAGRPVRVLVR